MELDLYDEDFACNYYKTAKLRSGSVVRGRGFYSHKLKMFQ